MPRENFNNEIKKALAQRAGYRCSICDTLTIGPSAETDESVNLTGVAAHIAAASPGGRRYNDLPVNAPERGSISNGIWLCATHADLIDGDETFFTSAVLQDFKFKHEEKISLEQKGLKTGNGLITRIEIANFGLIQEEVALEFSNKNLILGVNGVGKTLICELIAALTNKKQLQRWHKYKWDETDAYCHIDYYKNEMLRFGIYISADNKVSYSFKGVPQPFLRAQFAVFYLSQDIYDFRNELNREREEQEELPLDESDLIGWLALYFNLSETEFMTVINGMRKEKKFFVNDIRINEAEKDIEVLYSTRSSSGFHGFAEFSGGEQQRIILEIALKIASYYTKFQTTILLLENTAIGTIDQTGLNKLLDIINKNDFAFQFFFTSFRKPDFFKTANYTVAELEMHKNPGKGRFSKFVTVKAH